MTQIHIIMSQIIHVPLSDTVTVLWRSIHSGTTVNGYRGEKKTVWVLDQALNTECCMRELIYNTFKTVNNKGKDQTVQTGL